MNINWPRIAIVSAIVLFLFALFFWLFEVGKVPQGYVGVRFSMYGTDKGVQVQPLEPGYYIVGPTSKLFVFPTSTQTQVFEDDGRTDQSVHFTTIEGQSATTAIGVTYHVDPTKVTTLFQKYRQGIDEITNVYLYNMLRDAMVRRTSNMGIEQVYGVGKNDLINQVQADVAAQVAPIGIVIEKVYLTGSITLPKIVMDGINKKIIAQQQAEQRNNELQTTKTEAQQAEVKAEGEAEARLTIAKAEAQAIQLRGDALKNNPGVAELNAIEKWDGHLPQYQLGGATPFVNIPAGSH
jgi:regulator of protease activity HflC (stomatin/prohibitin superfamily)